MKILLLFFILNFAVASDWEESFKEDGITVYKKLNHSGPIIPLMAKGQINSPINVILSVLGDSDKRPDWVPRQKSLQLVKFFDHFDRIEASAVHVPWPFNDREFVYRATTKINAKKRSVIIEMKSIEYPPFKNNHVRGFMHDGSIIINEVTPSVYELTIMFQSDPKGAIPTWIINIAQKSWPVKFIQALRLQVKKVEDSKSYTYKDVDIFNLKK